MRQCKDALQRARTKIQFVTKYSQESNQETSQTEIASWRWGHGEHGNAWGRTRGWGTLY